ncbi:hypothetical protein M5K25_005493 [Dendrobium thyrsiflorum]|uniref:DUF4283 domain-containing protein n=1 Tax=Dendrobium thyrsiflorum TaxID=117978 RepID=A0ABD0UCE4_DENTH
MDPSLFPPLPTTSNLPSSSNPHKPLSFDRILLGSPNPCEFSIAPIPTPDEIIDFPSSDIAGAVEEWNLALVGYSLGKRPFYEALLTAVHKLWKLKGNLKLISLSEGFFLFKFSCPEDLEMVWTKGAWFIFGKPFVFQKWSPHFTPRREEFTSVPIWFKIHDLPLCCWTPTGISKIATKIGYPLAVDALTASKSRLTYARVCVQVDASASYPDTIPICVDGKIFNLQIQYEWRPSICSCCKSLNHQEDQCPSNPCRDNQVPKPPPKTLRGRSTSRKPRPLSLNAKGILPTPINASVNVNPNNPPTPPCENVTTEHSSDHPAPPISSVLIPPTLHSTQAVHSDCVNFTDNVPKTIPNLNSPSKDTSSSTESLIHSKESPTTKIISPNKFALLQAPSEAESASSLELGDQSGEQPIIQKSSSKPTQATSKVSSHSQRQSRAKGSRR